MEEKYKGYDIEYNEDKAIFQASNGQHSFVHAQLKELRRKIDRQAAHDKGFKPFEAWYFDDSRPRRVRVTSVNPEEPHYDYGPDRKPLYRVRITYLDKVEDNSWQRNEVDHTSIFALDPESKVLAGDLIILVGERDALTERIEKLAEKIPRITPGDLGIEEK